MPMQAELCGLMARDTSLLMKNAGNRPGKAQKVGSKRRLMMLMPEQALGGRSVHKAGSNGQESF